MADHIPGQAAGAAFCPLEGQGDPLRGTAALLDLAAWPGRIDEAGATHVMRSSLEGNLALAARALPGIQGVRVTRAWTGLAPNLTRAPVISATPGLPRLWHAVSGNGYTLGPVMGRMLADAVLGRSALPAAFAL